MTISPKRLLDLTLTVPAWIVSLPLQGLTAAVIAVVMGRPILFRQQRPGLNGQPFEIVKFRTMLTPDQVPEPSRDDASRLTPLGSFLRSTSLDELPTLWNVIKGDMSLVGPRPLLMSYLDLYSPDQAHRHSVRPGLTGLAQVNGRNSLSWDEKFAFDLEYVAHHSIVRDLRIIAATVRQVLARQGISAERSATMHPFTGRSP